MNLYHIKVMFMLLTTLYSLPVLINMKLWPFIINAAMDKLNKICFPANPSYSHLTDTWGESHPQTV